MLKADTQDSHTKGFSWVWILTWTWTVDTAWFVTIYSLGIPGHLEGVGGEELLAALLAPVLVVAGVGPLVGAQVAWRDITCSRYLLYLY